MPQVSPEHYDFSQYDEFRRWSSYWHQIRAVVSTGARKILEIGTGTGLLSWYLANVAHLNVTTFDFDGALTPDVVGDVRQITSHFACSSFECVCAFEVLEHVPWEQFQPALEQISCISGKHVLLSAPYWGHDLQFRATLLKPEWTLRWGTKLPYPRSRSYTWSFDGQHHWEIGTKGHSLKDVLKMIRQVLIIKRHYFCVDNPYHYFFECEVPN